MAISLGFLEKVIRANHKQDQTLDGEVQQSFIDAAGGNVDYLIADLVMVINYYFDQSLVVKEVQGELEQSKITSRKAEAKVKFQEQEILKLRQLLDEAKNSEYKMKQVMLDNIDMKNDLKQMKKSLEILNETNGHYRQRLEVQSGKKIAYKESASLKEVFELYSAGRKPKEIASLLGVSVATVYNRINDLKAEGVIEA